MSLILYNHACFANNISMNVKNELKPGKKIRTLLKEQNGILLTSDLTKQIDVQFVTEALKRYVSKNERNIDLLYSYAKQFRIQKFARTTIEVLL